MKYSKTLTMLTILALATVVSGEGRGTTIPAQCQKDCASCIIPNTQHGTDAKLCWNVDPGCDGGYPQCGGSTGACWQCLNSCGFVNTKFQSFNINVVGEQLGQFASLHIGTNKYACTHTNQGYTCPIYSSYKDSNPKLHFTDGKN